MKKNVTMQILSLTVLLAFLCMPLAINAQGSKANFSGKWAFNAEKSDMGQQGQGGGRMGGMGGGDFTATQEANLLTVERTRQGRDGQTMNITSKYYTHYKYQKRLSHNSFVLETNYQYYLV